MASWACSSTGATISGSGYSAAVVCITVPPRVVSIAPLASVSLYASRSAAVITPMARKRQKMRMDKMPKSLRSMCPWRRSPTADLTTAYTSRTLSEPLPSVSAALSIWKISLSRRVTCPSPSASGSRSLRLSCARGQRTRSTASSVLAGVQRGHRATHDRVRRSSKEKRVGGGEGYLALPLNE